MAACPDGGAAVAQPTNTVWGTGSESETLKETGAAPPWPSGTGAGSPIDSVGRGHHWIDTSSTLKLVTSFGPNVIASKRSVWLPGAAVTSNSTGV